MMPWWDSMICWQIDSPKPEFFLPTLVLKNGSKIFFIVSSGRAKNHQNLIQMQNAGRQWYDPNFISHSVQED